MLWRNKANIMRDKIKDDIVKGTDKLKRFNTTKNGPELLDKTDKKAKGQKKRNLLRSGVKRRTKEDKLTAPFNLAKYFLRWKKKADKKVIHTKQSRLQNKVLNYLVKYEDKPQLMKHWYKWKNVGLKKPNNYPVMAGGAQLKKTLLKNPYKQLKKNTSMMNLKIPRDMTLHQAILRGKINQGKSIALRNISIKPYLKKWDNNTKKLANGDLIHNIFSKLFNKREGALNKVYLRRCLNIWNTNAN